MALDRHSSNQKTSGTQSEDYYALVRRFVSKHPDIAIGTVVILVCLAWWAGVSITRFIYGDPSMARVSGRVESDLGSLSGHAIFFLPEGGGAKAWSSFTEDGCYELSFNGEDNQILPGRYRVVIIDKRMEEIPEDADRIGVRVQPEFVVAEPSFNEFDFKAEKIPAPLRYSFTCDHEPQALLAGLRKGIEFVSWGLKDGRKPMIWGRFSIEDKTVDKNGVCIIQVSPNTYELEDWATVLENRGQWPEPLSREKLLKYIQARKVEEL